MKNCWYPSLPYNVYLIYMYKMSEMLIVLRIFWIISLHLFCSFGVVAFICVLNFSSSWDVMSLNVHMGELFTGEVTVQ